jgi:hypothetical protein
MIILERKPRVAFAASRLRQPWAERWNAVGVPGMGISPGGLERQWRSIIQPRATPWVTTKKPESGDGGKGMRARE